MLDRDGETLRLLLEGVEVLGEQRHRAAVVDTAGVGDPPARRLQVDADPVEDGERAAEHAGGGAAAGDLGHVRQVGQLAEDEPDRLVEGVLVVPGVRPDAAGERHRAADARDVAVIVQEPTTRVPS